MGMPPSIHHEASSDALHLPDITLVDANDDHPPKKSIPYCFFVKKNPTDQNLYINHLIQL